MSLASPWPPPPCFLTSAPFLPLTICESSSCSPLLPERRDRWATRPLTVITDPFPSHHLAPDLLSLSSEHRALFLQSQTQGVVMIPVHLGHSPWANWKCNSCGWFCSYYCTDFILLVYLSPLQYAHQEYGRLHTLAQDFCLHFFSLLRTVSLFGADSKFPTGQTLCVAGFLPLRVSSI